jgi:hypothetical protein
MAPESELCAIANDRERITKVRRNKPERVLDT